MFSKGGGHSIGFGRRRSLSLNAVFGRGQGVGGEETAESGAKLRNIVTRYMDSQETLPDTLVRLLDNEDGDSSKVVLRIHFRVA